MKSENRFLPNNEYHCYFSSLIKCYKYYYQSQTKDIVVDVVFFLQGDVYQYYVLLEDAAGQYVSSSGNTTSSKKYERVIPLFDKIPYFPGFLLYNNGLYGLMDSNFDELIPCSYQSLDPCCFAKESNPYKNEVTMSTVALFRATKPNASSEFITVDGCKVFKGYDYIDPLRAEVEYRYYHVDDFIYHTVVEKLKSLIIRSDFECRCVRNMSFPRFEECVYKIIEFEDVFELHIEEPALEDLGGQRSPKRTLRIHKVQNFAIEKEAIDKTNIEAEKLFGMIRDEYLLRAICKDISEDAPIDVFDLTVRVYNSLKRVGIKTVYDLWNTPEEDLLEIKNIGEKGKQEVLRVRKVLCEVLQKKDNGD